MDKKKLRSFSIESRLLITNTLLNNHNTNIIVTNIFLKYIFNKYALVNNITYDDKMFNFSFDSAFNDVYPMLDSLYNKYIDEEFNDIEALSWIYQYFNVVLKDEAFEMLKNNEKISSDKVSFATQVFTPKWVTEYLVNSSIGNMLGLKDLKFKVNNIDLSCNIKDIKIIDPCMGTGLMLLHAFDVLLEKYVLDGFSLKDASKLILENNLYGLDIDEGAYKVACFSLLMKGFKYGLTSANLNIFLIKDNILGSLLQESSDKSINKVLNTKYDVVITNPPYMGKKSLNKNLSSYIDENYELGKSELYSAFIVRCLELCKDNGYVSMITIHSWMFIKSFSNLRNHIIDNYYIESMVHSGAGTFDDLNSFNALATAFVINKHKRYNQSVNQSNFEESILMPLRGDELDVYRQEYNKMLLDKAMGANSIMQVKLITISVAKKDIKEARSYFACIGADLTAHFAALGSKCAELTADDRLRVFHDFFRPGDENAYSLSLSTRMKLGHDFRDYICPDSLEKHSDYLRIGNKFARVLYLKDYASYIKDSMVTELTDLNRSLMFSIDVVPIPTDEAVREVESRLLGVETNITNWQRRQNSNNNFSAVVPYDMELQRKESKEFLDDLTTRDQRMMFAVMTMVHTADTKEQLDSDTDAILSIARKHMCQMAILKYQQMDGLKTVLPFGVRKIDAFRTLTTESLAVFIPFKVQEIMDKGGIYFGENAISHNLIMCNRENLMNQSTFILGVPGSGKSFSAKELIFFLLLNTDDDILICDPEGEYATMLESMQKIASIIRVSAGGRDRLNAMYMVDGYGENNPIVVKSQFIMSLVEQIDRKGVGPQQKSIIDRCTAAVYREAEETGIVPTLNTLRQKLLEQPEPEAKKIALSLELYTTGSLDIFGHGSNVDLDERVVVFDIHGLGTQLKPAGLLVITDTMLNRVTLNWKRGKRTHVFIDEFHVVFENEFSAEFFNSAWRQFRKRNAYPTAITQNVEYLLDSVQASTMLSNSEFIIMLNQAASDREKLAKLLNISNEQMSYITNAESGCGLIKYGGALVPFVNRFPKDTLLYQLMTTRPGEGTFAGGQA